jgi:predicted enzyme related to lactoylglutathione lyase
VRVKTPALASLAALASLFCLSACASDSKSGTTKDNDSGGNPSSTPITDPYLRAGGVGVTDLEKASSFLTGVLGMSQEGQDVTLADRVERTFFAKEANRGSRVILMKFKDGRNTQDITAKLVFSASDVMTTYMSALNAGYASILPPVSLGSILVSQVKGPEGYTVEILNGLDDGGAGIPQPYFIALAFGVTDFDAAQTFYGTAFGMKKTVPYMDTDLIEQSMEYPKGGGAALVLQHYAMTTHNYLNNPVEHVSFVPDLNSFVTQVTAAGGVLVTPAAPMPAYDDKLGAVLKDPDGYVIELVQG